MTDKAKTSFPYLALFPGDVLRETIPWTGEQRALLVLLMMYAFATDLPADESEVARIIQYDPKQFRELWPTVKTAFNVLDGKLVHADVEKHRDRAARTRHARIEAGKRGAKARAEKSANGKGAANGPAND